MEGERSARQWVGMAEENDEVPQASRHDLIRQYISGFSVEPLGFPIDDGEIPGILLISDDVRDISPYGGLDEVRAILELARPPLINSIQKLFGKSYGSLYFHLTNIWFIA